MKLEGKVALRHSNIGLEPESQSFVFIDDRISDGYKLPSQKLKEYENEMPTFLEKTEQGLDSLQYDMESVDCEKNEYEAKVKDLVEPVSHSSKDVESLLKFPNDIESVKRSPSPISDPGEGEGSPRNSVDVYMVKTVTECEPHSEECYNESNYHDVKDICIDEGVLKKDNVVFVNPVDEKARDFFPFESCETKEKQKDNTNINVLSLTPTEESDKVSANHNQHKDLMLTEVSGDHPPRPPHNPPKPQSMRLQKIRPPPLTPINRPRMPPPLPVPAAAPHPVPHNNAMPRPAQFGQPLPSPGDIWSNTTESPISAYMRYLQNSIMDPSSRGNQVQPQPHPYPQPQIPGNVQPHPPPSSAMFPNPPMPMFPSPRFNGPVPPMNATNSPVPTLLPSPQANGPPPPLLSPTSQFLLPSPTGYMNLLSPHSPYPLLSPGIQFPSPLTPNFPFSSTGQSGILGPGPQPPPSPGLVFPLSPSGFFPISSPRWRDH